MRRGLRGSHNPTRPTPEGNAGSDRPPRPPVLIALIDPKPLTRESILKMLDASLSELDASLSENAKLLGVSCFDELLYISGTDEFVVDKEHRIIVILYIRNAGVADNWVQAQLQLIKSQQPEIPVIMISDRDDAGNVVCALNCGVRGYIPTSMAAEVAVAVLILVEAGGTYIPAGTLLSEWRGAEEDPEKDEQPQLVGKALKTLTSRELAVIDLLREGSANKVIANRLNMRESTVKVHVRNILKKLRATNRTHAATVVNRLLTNAAPGERPH